MLETYQRQAKQRLIATVVSIVVIAGFVMYVDHIKALTPTKVSSFARTTQPAPAQSAPPTSSGSSSSSDDSSGGSTPPASSSGNATPSSYKDGTYSATSNYYVPRSVESIKVTLIIKNGVISDATVANSESDRTSAMFQEDFASSYKSYVVGQKLSGLQLSVVSGASDTTQGFNDALNQIATQAQS